MPQNSNLGVSSKRVEARGRGKRAGRGAIAEREAREVTVEVQKRASRGHNTQMYSEGECSSSVLAFISVLLQ